MTNSHNNNATSSKSCFSSILRRLLCTGSLPTHPSDSDHLPEFGTYDNYVPKKVEQEVKVLGGTPSVVARLMGLESLPSDMTWVPHRDNTLYGHLRSRSVNSADYSSPLDHSNHESYHRRVRTSVSFREIPTTFLVCVDKNKDDCQSSSSGDNGLKSIAPIDDQEKSKSSTSSNGSSSGKKLNKNEKIVVLKKKENFQEINNKRTNVDQGKTNTSLRVQSNVFGQKESNHVYVKTKTKREAKHVEEQVVCVGVKGSHRRRAKNVVEPKSHSSVDSLNIISGKSRTRASNIPAAKKKKNSTTPKVVDKYFDYPCVNCVTKSNVAVDDNNQQVLRGIHITKSEKLLRRREVEYYIDKLVEVCRLTDEDTNLSPNNWPWVLSSSSSRDNQVIEFEDYQDVCFEFGQEILDMLVQQIVDELC